MSVSQSPGGGLLENGEADWSKVLSLRCVSGVGPRKSSREFGPSRSEEALGCCDGLWSRWERVTAAAALFYPRGGYIIEKFCLYQISRWKRHGNGFSE